MGAVVVPIDLIDDLVEINIEGVEPLSVEIPCLKPLVIGATATDERSAPSAAEVALGTPRICLVSAAVGVPNATSCSPASFTATSTSAVAGDVAPELIVKA